MTPEADGPEDDRDDRRGLHFPACPDGNLPLAARGLEVLVPCARAECCPPGAGRPCLLKKIHFSGGDVIDAGDGLYLARCMEIGKDRIRRGCPFGIEPCVLRSCGSQQVTRVF